MAALLSVTAVAGAQNVDLIGAGASFPAPLITAMADDYRDLTAGRVRVNYQSIGSGGGIRQFLEQTIQFGATESFLNSEQLQEAAARGGGIAFNMPITIGDVVAVYNLPGVGSGLVFDGATLAEVFMGAITSWSDPRIAALNPDVDLPDLPITVVYRSDSSGSTNIWTSYLGKSSPAWNERVGAGNSVSWPTGIGGRGNEGVSGVVQNTPGTIGYSSLAYAAISDISYAWLVNKSGNVIAPSLAATSAAADVEIAADTRLLITDTDAPDGYPAAGFSWVLLYENLDASNAIRSRAEAEELVRFLLWTITDGQELSELLSFSRIPDAVLELNLAMLRQVKWQGAGIGREIVSAAGY